MLEKYTKVKISDILNPKEGRICYGPSFWIVTPDEEVLFYCGTPQCNTNLQIVKRLLLIHPNCIIRDLPMVFIEHNCYDSA